MSIKKILNFFITIFVLSSLCYKGQSQAWFFHYNKPVAEPVEETVSSQKFLATIVIVQGDNESKNTQDCIDQLKITLQEKFHGINVLIGKQTSMEDRKIQIPSITNHKDVDLALSLRITCCPQQKPALHIYRYSWGQEFITKITEMAFYPLEDAYLFSKKTTISWATNITKKLTTSYKDLFDTSGPYACPFKPLAGIKKPALGFELCLGDNNQWSFFINPLVDVLEPIINPLLQQRNRTTII